MSNNNFWYCVTVLVITVLMAGCPHPEEPPSSIELQTDSTNTSESDVKDLKNLNLHAVFKHHPATLDNTSARNEDYRLLLNEASKAELILLASDDFLLIKQRDIGAWQKMVLANQNRFKHYIPFRKDSEGYGFLIKTKP